jgi:hypothetical protein
LLSRFWRQNVPAIQTRDGFVFNVEEVESPRYNQILLTAYSIGGNEIVTLSDGTERVVNKSSTTKGYAMQGRISESEAKKSGETSASDQQRMEMKKHGYLSLPGTLLPAGFLGAHGFLMTIGRPESEDSPRASRTVYEVLGNFDESSWVKLYRKLPHGDPLKLYNSSYPFKIWIASKCLPAFVRLVSNPQHGRLALSIAVPDIQKERNQLSSYVKYEATRESAARNITFDSVRLAFSNENNELCRLRAPREIDLKDALLNLGIITHHEYVMSSGANPGKEDRRRFQVSIVNRGRRRSFDEIYAAYRKAWQASDPEHLNIDSELNPELYEEMRKRTLLINDSWYRLILARMLLRDPIRKTGPAIAPDPLKERLTARMVIERFVRIDPEHNQIIIHRDARRMFGLARKTVNVVEESGDPTLELGKAIKTWIYFLYEPIIKQLTQENEEMPLFTFEGISELL